MLITFEVILVHLTHAGFVCELFFLELVMSLGAAVVIVMTFERPRLQFH